MTPVESSHPAQPAASGRAKRGVNVAGVALGRDFENEAARRVLWDLSASLETVLVAPFQADYLDVVETARAAVLGDTQ